MVGASHKANRPSNEVMRFLQSRGFKVTPINPTLAGKEILGSTTLESIADLPTRVDMIEIFRNSESAGAICEEVLTLPKSTQPEVVWMQVGVVNEDAASALRKAGITVVMDHCPKRVIQKEENLSTLT